MARQRGLLILAICFLLMFSSILIQYYFQFSPKEKFIIFVLVFLVPPLLFLHIQQNSIGLQKWSPRDKGIRIGLYYFLPSSMRFLDGPLDKADDLMRDACSLQKKENYQLALSLFSQARDLYSLHKDERLLEEVNQRIKLLELDLIMLDSEVK